MNEVPSKTPDRAPAHPLVIDRLTKKTRLATQADIQRMETICVAYVSLIENARNVVQQANYLTERLENTYGR